VPRPQPEIMKDGVRRDSPLLQFHRVHHQVRSCLPGLPSLHLLTAKRKGVGGC
jgi:hypothetical protein